jgi:DUF2971 family protein
MNNGRLPEGWRTDLAVANDPRELSLGHQHFIDAMRFVRENEYKGEVGNFIQTIDNHITNYRAIQQTFCACFSTVGDDLPMWREYGSNYSGVAVGFRPTAITSMPGRIQKVKYLSPDTPEDFRQAVRDVAANFDTRHDPNDSLYWMLASVGVFALMTALKHHSWSYEKEIRFIHAQVRDQPKPGGLDRIAEYSDETPVAWEQPRKRLLSACTRETLRTLAFLCRLIAVAVQALSSATIWPGASRDDLRHAMQRYVPNARPTGPLAHPQAHI